MADKILHKRSSTPSAVPSAASLELGELALNTADGRAFMKKSNGSVVEIGAAGSAFFSLVTVTATSTGQTSFTIPGGYTPGAIVVFLNGASLAPAHYTATNGTNVVLASGTGVAVGSELVVLRLSAFEVADALPLGGTAVDSSKLSGVAPSASAISYLAASGAFSFRNKIINGDMRINQRGFNGTWSALAEGSYGFDRWKRSGANISQVIEADNFKPDTVHTLSGTGVTTQQITSPSSGHWTITVPNTAMNVQLEEGEIATPFELRPIGVELALCQRYFWRGVPTTGHNVPPNYYPNVFSPIVVMFPVTLRAIPTLSTNTSGWTFNNCYPTGFDSPSKDGGRFAVVVQTAGSQGYWLTNNTGWLQADAEL